jgi:hypothetical protein
VKSKKAEPTSTYTISPGIGDQQDVEEGESDLGAARRESKVLRSFISRTARI